MARLDVLWSTLHDLSDDLLLEVFIAGIFSERFPSDSKISFPVAVSQVCQHWRNLALTSPLLWTDTHSPTTLTPYLATLFIERSKPLPLNLYVTISTDMAYISGGIHHQAKPVMREVIYALEHALNRIKSLYIILCDMSHLDPTYAAIKATSFPTALTSMAFVGTDSGAYARGASTLGRSIGSPAHTVHSRWMHSKYPTPPPPGLKSLTIRDTCYTCLPRPFQGLIYLEVNFFFPDFAQFHGLFEGCPELCTLVLVNFATNPGATGTISNGQDLGPKFDKFINETTIHAPSLKFLKVGSCPMYQDPRYAYAREDLIEQDVDVLGWHTGCHDECRCGFKLVRAPALEVLEVCSPSSVALTHFLPLIRDRDCGRAGDGGNRFESSGSSHSFSARGRRLLAVCLRGAEGRGSMVVEDRHAGILDALRADGCEVQLAAGV